MTPPAEEAPSSAAGAGAADSGSPRPAASDPPPPAAVAKGDAQANSSGAAPPPPSQAPASSSTAGLHKAFVGGISWHLNDADLKDSAFGWPGLWGGRRLLPALPWIFFLLPSPCARQCPHATASHAFTSVPHTPPEFAPYHATHASVMLDRSTNRSRGFGFVYFATAADLEAAIKVRGRRGISFFLCSSGARDGARGRDHPLSFRFLTGSTRAQPSTTHT